MAAINRIYDKKNNKKYESMDLVGDGGFSKCYKIKDVATKNVYAAKIVSIEMLSQHREININSEIGIHRSLKHKNIVKFHNFFHDSHNVYIVLELCKNRSMMELIMARKNITDYECRYVINQIAQGVKYLHDNRIIHRDLKLDNLLLDDQLNVKIADFGFATKIEFEGQRKYDKCGTLDYIAPEIVLGKGYSFEVDIWSVGCIMYTLLVGNPPFQEDSIEKTYENITMGGYTIPGHLHKDASDMIIAILQTIPEKRPTAAKLLEFKYITTGPMPVSLPSSCLTMAPSADDHSPSTFMIHDQIEASGHGHGKHNEEIRNAVESLMRQLTDLLSQKVKLDDNLSDENTDPANQPLFWVSRWVDYSDKCGFGYELCDGGIGIIFNDTTELIMLSNGINVHFIDKSGKETYMTVNEYLTTVEKKMELLLYFKGFINDRLDNAGKDAVVLENDPISRIPHLHSWFRTPCAVLMHLTNGTVQLNFTDHVKIILCPRMSSVTYMKREHFRTYKFSTILKHGCSKDIFFKIRYAHEKLKTLLKKLS